MAIESTCGNCMYLGPAIIARRNKFEGRCQWMHENVLPKWLDAESFTVMKSWGGCPAHKHKRGS